MKFPSLKHSSRRHSHPSPTSGVRSYARINEQANAAVRFPIAHAFVPLGSQARWGQRCAVISIAPHRPSVAGGSGEVEMTPILVRSAWMLLVALLPAVAGAYVGPPRVEPAHPRSNRPVSVVVTTSGCHVFLDAADGVRTVERAGSRIDVTIEGFEGLGNACFFFPPTEHAFPIGALPPGSYELHFHFYEPGADPERFETGIVTFVVAEPLSIPATSIFALAAGVAMLLAVGADVLRRRFRLFLVMLAGTLRSAGPEPGRRTLHSRTRMRVVDHVVRATLPARCESNVSAFEELGRLPRRLEFFTRRLMGWWLKERNRKSPCALRALASAALAGFTLLGAGTASAFVDNVRVEPAHPIAGRSVQLVARAGECHGFPSDGHRTLEQDGNRLRVLAEGLALPPGDAFCILPAHELRFDLGALAAGSYEVELVLVDASGFAAPINVGTVAFGVGSPSRVPARSDGSLLLLATFVAAAGITWFRRSRAGSWCCCW